MVATTTSALVQVGVKEWMFGVFLGVGCLVRLAIQAVLCVRSYSIFRGLIGPKRQFGTGETYHPQLYALLFGALIPIPFWLWQRKFPQSRLKYVNMPVLLNGPTWIPPATGINYSSWFVVGFIFRES
jgi:hypothetical protein